MKIYVGTYAKYNNGSIYGKWLDVTDYANKDKFLAACLELHKDESNPELMFQDWEDIPECFISECGVSKSLWEYAELSDDEKTLIEDYIYVMSISINDKTDISVLLSDAEEARFCHVDDFDECVTESFIDGYAIPEHVQNYLDFERIIKDASFDYTQGENYYFYNY